MEEKNLETRAISSLINEERVISFSDAVFAFAATLLVLKIDLPSLSQTEITSPHLTQALINLWPQYLANIISFLMIGYYWLTHHAIFSLISKMNSVIIWLNLFFLIFLSFLPFPVDLFGDFNNSDIIVGFYSLSLALAGVLLALIWFYALGANLIDKNLSKKQITYYSLRFTLAPIVFAISIPLAFIDTNISKFSWIFVILGTWLISKRYYHSKIIVNKGEL